MTPSAWITNVFPLSRWREVYVECLYLWLLNSEKKHIIIYKLTYIEYTRTAMCVQVYYISCIRFPTRILDIRVAKSVDYHSEHISAYIKIFN